jgi:calcium/calmodulin-dependent protein kinase I
MGCLGSKEKAATPANGGGAATTAPTKTKETAGSSADKPEADETRLDADSEGKFQDNYVLGDEIGRGGFSVVYRATSKKTGTAWAVKIIEKSLLQDDIKLLRREIAIMKKVDHTNILRLKEIYEDGAKVYIVMELVEGSELFDRIVDKGYYSEKNAINIVNQILSAVEYLHSQGIAHRDLKPENLLCSGSDESEIVKIADFGLSKIFNDEEELRTSCGTPGYVAPEVLMCESYDKSVDMWGIGIITYILLAGYPPFYAENDIALFEKIMNAEYDFEDDCWDDVSELAKDFIKHLLVKEASSRYTAEEAIRHPWLASDASDKQLKIGRKMSEYNLKRKEDKAKFQAGKEDSIAALNKARSTVKK